MPDHLIVLDPGAPVGRRVEVRCPHPVVLRPGVIRPGRLFMVLHLDNAPVLSGGCIEVYCWDCRKRLAAEGQRARVLHRYDLEGVLVGTLVKHEEVTSGKAGAGSV